MNEKILIIDDEEDIRLLIQGLLEDEGYNVSGVANSDRAYEVIEDETPDLIVQDIWLQGSKDDGIEILKTVKQNHPDLPFLMISGHGTIETAVSAIKIGAYDFIEKPFKSDRLLLMIERALENSNLKQQNFELKYITSRQRGDASDKIPANIVQKLDKIAPTNSRVFIIGEPVIDKNMVAQYIHEKSKRSDMPFIILNCTNINQEQLEIELFGVVNKKIGLLELVNGGTLVFDEVAKLPVETQVKIISLLQENSYCKIGSDIKIPIDIRVIATSSNDVEQEIANGSFNNTLYHRINVVQVDIDSFNQFKPQEQNSDFMDVNSLLQMGLREARECFERYYLLSQVNRFEGNISKTSEFIGMERSALHRKLKSLEVLSDDKKGVA